MKINYIVSVKRVLLFLISFLPFVLAAQPRQDTLKPLQDYFFIGEHIQLKTGVNFFVLTERKQFNRFFGDLNRPDTPHFEKELMLVMVMRETNRDAKLSFYGDCMYAGDFAEVQCRIKTPGGKLPYKTYPLAAAVIPRKTGLKKVYFYCDGKKYATENVE